MVGMVWLVLVGFGVCEFKWVIVGWLVGLCEENGGIKEGLLSEGEVNEGIILFETVDI
jgi:hypothetical protein